MPPAPSPLAAEPPPPWARREPSLERRALRDRRPRGTSLSTRCIELLLGVALALLALFPAATELASLPPSLRFSVRAVLTLGAAWWILDAMAALWRAYGLGRYLSGPTTRERELRDTTTLGPGLGQPLLLGALLAASLPAQVWLLDAPWELRSAFGGERAWDAVLAAVGIADLLAIAWIHGRARDLRARSRAGRLRARLAQGARARPGEKLSGRVWIPTPNRSPRVRLTLRYVEERFEEDRSGEHAEWVVFGDETYAETLEAELPEGQGATPVERAFTFVLPTTPPRPHRPWGPAAAYWELELEAGGQVAIFTLP